MGSTLQIDRMGALHIWHGEVVPVPAGKYNYAPEADIYVQDSQDVDAMLDYLHVSAEDRQELWAGWTVYTEEAIDE